MSWKAWYTEGREFSSAKHDWQELPDDGVLAVLVFGEEIPGQGRRYRKILQGDRCEWYYMLGSSIHCSPDKEKEDILERYPDAKHFKHGKWDEDLEFDKVIQKAIGTQEPEDCGCS